MRLSGGGTTAASPPGAEAAGTSWYKSHSPQDNIKKWLDEIIRNYTCKLVNFILFRLRK